MLNTTHENGSLSGTRLKKSNSEFLVQRVSPGLISHQTSCVCWNLVLLQKGPPDSRLHLTPNVMSSQRATEVSPPVISSQQEEAQSSQDTGSMPVLGFLKALPNRTILHNTVNNLTQVSESSLTHILHKTSSN